MLRKLSIFQVIVYLQCVMTVLSCCAQNKSNKSTKSTAKQEQLEKVEEAQIQKDLPQAFYKIVTPGTIQVDENGNEVRPKRSYIFYTVYLETDSDQIQWLSAKTGNQVFEISPTAITDTKFTVGRTAEDAPPIKKKKKTNKYLWMLKLEPEGGTKEIINTPAKTGIIINWKTNGKEFKSTTEAPIHLFTHPSV